MKKVALLMSGDCRLLWLAAPSINKYVVEPNQNADIFLYLNKDSMIPQVDNEEEVVKQVFNKNVKGLVFTDEKYDKEVKELIENNYAKIEAHYKKLNRNKWDKMLNIHNTDQYFKLKKCAELAVDYANKNGFKYDLMLRCRPDIGWLNKFYLLLPAPDTLYVNHSLHHILDNHFAFWVEDTCFFGGQDVMHKFCTDFSDKMVDELTVCDERYDLSCATEKLLGRVLLNSGIKYTGINDYFGYKGNGWIRPKLSKYFVDWTKSPNYYLVEKFCKNILSENNPAYAVYFDRIGENIVMDETIIQ